MRKILVLAACIIFLAGCKKNDTDTVTPVTTPVPTRYLTCKIDGVPYSATDGKNGVANNQRAYLSIGSNVAFLSGLSTNPTAPKDAFVFNLVSDVPYPASLAQFKSQFVKGSYPFWSDFSPTGFDITYFDASGHPWSAYGMNQATSSFEITSATYRSVGNNSFMDVKATFNCQLEYNGSTKEITEATFCLTFGNQ